MGNRTSGGGRQGVRKTFVRLPGFLVSAQVCVPRAHAHALWLLPWVERLLLGQRFDEILSAPPWPQPVDALVVDQLVRTLLDLRWVVPDWTSPNLIVAPALARRFSERGRIGLAQELFDAEIISGEWWADGLGGTVLARETALQFDWDFARKADISLEPTTDHQALLDATDPDLTDLVLKLGGVDSVWGARDRVFLGTSLLACDRKDILFAMYGEQPRLLPDELRELEPVLRREAPGLFGQKQARKSRVIRLSMSPVELLAAEIEKLRADPATLGPLELVRARCKRITAIIDKHEAELEAWLAGGQNIRAVCGETQRQFDAFAELCEALPVAQPSWLVLTSAFLNERNLDENDGLVAALESAPHSTRFLLVYGHASDDPPERQRRDIERWTARLFEVAPALVGRVDVSAGKRRSHEKAIVSSAGDWMIGSWNATSSRPHALVNECSVVGRCPRFARQLLDVLGANVEGDAAVQFLRETRARLDERIAASPGEASHRERVALLRHRISRLVDYLAENEPSLASWSSAMRLLRRAFFPFLTCARIELIDEQQTRDAFVTHARAARRSVLLASDRLADSALDRATIRDLGARHGRKTVRVVWGREWAGHTKSGSSLSRARQAISEARKLLGPALLVSDSPMENHAKLLIVDGLRGIVTSENLLSYGGEKGRHESRELGVVFWSPVVARHVLGCFLHRWPDPLAGDRSAESVVLPWVVAGNEAWHAHIGLANELEFDWRAPDYIGAVVRDELTHAATSDDQVRARAEAWLELERRAGPQPYPWLRDEAERLGLVQASSARWYPHDTTIDEVDDDEPEVAESTSTAPSTVPVVFPQPSTHPLVARVLAEMVEVPAGRFRMGDKQARGERPRHVVVISRGFWMARCPVTQGLWQEITGGLPHLRDSERHPQKPIIHVSHRDIEGFLSRLNVLPGGGGFALPTEAEWEYACRAGAETRYCFGDEPGRGRKPGRLEEYAWTKRNSNKRLQPVGLLKANDWGLHDMHGLVYEATRDGRRTFVRNEVVDPVGPLTGDDIVARGGCWGRFPLDRSGKREREHFRCASRQVFEKSHRCSFRLLWREKEGI